MDCNISYSFKTADDSKLKNGVANILQTQRNNNKSQKCIRNMEKNLILKSRDCNVNPFKDSPVICYKTNFLVINYLIFIQ